MAPQRINFHLNLPPSVIGNPFLVGVITDFAWEGSFWWEHQQNLVSGAAVTLFQSAADDLMTQPNENILSLYPHLPPSPITPNPPPNRSHFRHSSTGSCTVHTGHKDMRRCRMNRNKRCQNSFVCFSNEKVIFVFVGLQYDSMKPNHAKKVKK